MDPTANLEEQLRLAAQLNAVNQYPEDMDANAKADLLHKALRLAELVEALDGWIRGGGFPPKQWKGR